MCRFEDHLDAAIIYWMVLIDAPVKLGIKTYGNHIEVSQLIKYTKFIISALNVKYNLLVHDSANRHIFSY